MLRPCSACPTLLLTTLLLLSACQPDETELGNLPVSGESASPSTTLETDAPWVTHIEYGDAAFEALIIHESGEAGALTSMVACAFGEGLAYAEFAADVVSVGESALLARDYDLLVLVAGTEPQFSQVGIKRALEDLADLAGLPVAVIVVGDASGIHRLGELREVLNEKQAFVVEAAVFRYPVPDWEASADTRTLGFVEAEAETLGRCVGEALLE